MDWLSALGGTVDAAIGLVSFLVLTWVVAQTARRLLGVRVGWPRTFLVCGVAILTLMGAVGPLLSSGWLPLTEDAAYRTLLYLGVLMLWTFALSAAVLVVGEVMVPTGSLPPVRAWLLGWRARWARTRRYTQIMGIAARHGLGAQLRGFGPRDPDDARTARSLRRALAEAGVTFTKLGQMLSTRADLLPEPYIRELSTLTNRAEPEGWDAVEQVLAAEVGLPLDKVFASVDTEPLASASVAQVHAATLADGRAVVVKVQRPGALAQVVSDLAILGRLAASLERNAAWARALGVRDLARGFSDSLAEELDYRVEVDNMAAVRVVLAGRGVRVPWVADDVCTPRLIVMERFEATPVAQASGLLEGWTGDQRREAASTLLSSVLAQITTEGVFHADLHPGNVVVWPDGEVGLLDFGSVGRLDAVSRRALAMLLWSIDADDPITATDSLLELLDRPDGLAERGLQREVGTLMTRFRGGLGSGGSLKVFGELFDLVVRHGFRVPPAVAAALRSLGGLEGTLRLIDPDLDLVDAARTTGREAVGEITPERVRHELSQRALRLVPVLEQLPRRVNKITQDLEAGRFTAHLRVVSHPDDQAFLLGLVQQVVIAVLAGAGALAGVLMLVAPGGSEVLPGISVLNLIGAVLSFAGFVLALRAVALVFARSR